MALLPVELDNSFCLCSIIRYNWASSVYLMCGCLDNSSQFSADILHSFAGEIVKARFCLVFYLASVNSLKLSSKMGEEFF